MPSDWKLLLEYKPYEPNFYHTIIPDWGTSSLICRQLGDRAKVLVDLGHHLPNTNIEQIVATLMHQNQLAGFHFNDSKYGDDDLTTGSIKPYQLFLIFCELIGGAEDRSTSLGFYFLDDRCQSQCERSPGRFDSGAGGDYHFLYQVTLGGPRSLS